MLLKWSLHLYFLSALAQLARFIRTFLTPEIEAIIDIMEATLGDFFRRTSFHTVTTVIPTASLSVAWLLGRAYPFALIALQNQLVTPCLIPHRFPVGDVLIRMHHPSAQSFLCCCFHFSNKITAITNTIIDFLAFLGYNYFIYDTA